MVQKISWPTTPLDTWTIYNDRQPWATDPEGVDRASDRMATGNRQMPVPFVLARPLSTDYDDDAMWLVTLRVPPYTKAVGLRARGVCQRVSTEPDANVALYYKYQGDAWSKYLVFNQAQHGSDSSVIPASAHWLAVMLPWVSTIKDAAPDEATILSAPLDVAASDEAQDVVLELKIETDLTFYLTSYQFFFVPYDGEPYPEVP